MGKVKEIDYVNRNMSISSIRNRRSIEIYKVKFRNNNIYYTQATRKRALISIWKLELIQVTFSSHSQWTKWKGRKHLLFMPTIWSGADLFYHWGLNSTGAAWLGPYHTSPHIPPHCPISPPSLSLQLHPGLMPSICLTAAYTPLSGSPAPLIHANLLLGKCRCLNNCKFSYHKQAKHNQDNRQGLPKGADSLK